MSYKEKPQIKLYKYENSAFVLQAIIDDYEEVSFNHSLYEAGEFSITINYNIPNALKFERGLWVQFGNDSYAFGEILKITDSIGEDGKGSQLRVITGHDARYIFKRRIIKNLNNDNTFSVTGKGEECIRSLVNSQCGNNAEKKRQLPIINNVDFSESVTPLNTNGGFIVGYNKKLKKYITAGCYSSNTSISVADANNPTPYFVQKYTSTNVIFYDIYCGRLNIVVAGSGIITSPDTETWTQKYNGIACLGVTYSEKLNKYIVCGTNGNIVTSSDGETWTEQSTGVSVNLWGITYSEEKSLFVIVGNEGTILTSIDGETWTSRTSGVSVNLRKVIFADEKFVAVGYSGTILESIDGINWQTITSGESVNLNNICYSFVSEGYYIVGDSGTVLFWNKKTGFEKKNYNLVTDLFAICEGDTSYQNYNFNLIYLGGGSQTDNKLVTVIRKVYFYLGEDFSVSEAYTNLYDVLVTTATQSKTGWRIKFENNLLFLECFIPQDLSSTVQFTTDFDSLSNGEFNDSSESYANSIFVGGKGTGSDRDIYEGEKAIDGNSPAGMERFEAWDNQSAMTTENEYEAEALAMLTQYGQTLTVSGNGLAKSPYVFKEEYNVGDTITLGFSGNSAKVQILNVTEHWSWGAYDLQFNFGKPQNDLGQQLQLILRQIQKASNKTSSTDSVRWYEIPIDYQQDSSEVIYNTIGFIGNCASGGSTFKLYLDNEKTGAKTYHVYFKQLGGGKLTLTTGKAGATDLVMNSGTYVAIIYVDALGNVSMAGASVTNLIESGNNQPASSDAVYQAIQSSGSGGTPLGTWASFENDYAPNIEWLQGGTTFNPNTYPALAMYLGGNTVPERFDHNRLGDAELITVEYLDASTSTLSNVTPTSFTTIAYDGEIEVNARFIGNQGLMGAYLNDKYIAFINIYGGGSGSPEYKTIALSVKKGDRLCLVFNRRYTSSTANTWLGSPYVQARYYKHPMFIKATPTSADSDYEGTLNAIREFYVRNNTYSTEERLTGGVWIDGKPIYRKVVSGLNISFTSSFGWTNTGVSAPNNLGLIINSKVLSQDSATDYSTISAIPSFVTKRNSDGLLYLLIAGNYSGSVKALIIEYTKTSD